jgi:hypothetical protein
MKAIEYQCKNPIEWLVLYMTDRTNIILSSSNTDVPMRLM